MKQNKKGAQNILSFLHESEKLKSVLRHSWLSSGRQESTPEHTWRMSLMAIVLAPHLEEPVDLPKVLTMATIHDLVEVYADDYPAWKGKKEDKQRIERESLAKIVYHLPDDSANKIKDMWEEFEAGETPEARFVQALDKLEVVIQHNEAPLSTWNEKEFTFNATYGTDETMYDPLLKLFRELLREETERKIADKK